MGPSPQPLPPIVWLTDERRHCQIGLHREDDAMAERPEFQIGNGGPGILTEQLRERLTAIQRGTAPDPHGWVERLF